MSERQASELAKWRADHVLKALWRVAHDRQRWHDLPSKPLHVNGCSRDLPGLRTAGAAYLMIHVRELPALNLEEHVLRLYRGDYARVLDTLSDVERHELKHHLAQPRYSAVFRHHARDKQVLRSHDAALPLATAALRIAAWAEVVT